MQGVDLIDDDPDSEDDQETIYAHKECWIIQQNSYDQLRESKTCNELADLPDSNARTYVT